jgi:protein-S-isoprenylcysteine O-methyltransferase Ste14
MWWVMAFLLHSPFLALFSFVWVPIFLAACLAEERDLLLRYGEAYEAYRRRKGFLLPRLRRREVSDQERDGRVWLSR